MSDLSQEALVALSEWIDAGNADRDPEALTLHRIMKLTEEAGEVVSATIGALGANPRKGVTNTFEKVLEELLDVAVTALGAFEHINGHQGRALSELDNKIVAVAARVGAITQQPDLDERRAEPDEDDGYEYGFYDGEHPGTIWWYCFGFPFTSAEDALRTGRKSTYGETVVVRRRPGATEWEHVSPERGT